MRLLASIVTLALMCCVHSVPVPGPSSVNPCTTEALYNVQYFHPSSTNVRDYIQCDPWGGMTVNSCPEGSTFDSMVIDCIYTNRTIKNVTFPMDDSFLNETFPQMNVTELSLCSYIGNYTCQNNGVCTQVEDGFRCICLSGFTGSYCETPLAESTGVFGLMINSSFSLDIYRLNRILTNTTMPNNMSMEFDLTFNGSALIDEAIRTRIDTYLARYRNGTMRFDSMINYFIEDFMSIIFPDAFFMREFTFLPEIQMGFSNVIPRLLMVTKYTYDNFDRLFAIYEDILLHLGDYLLAKSPMIKEEAMAFHEVYELLNAKMDKMYNVSESDKHTMHMEKMSMRQLFVERIRAELNNTLFSTYELFRGLVNLQNMLSFQQQFNNITMEQMGYVISNFTIQPETVILINDIMMRSTKVWDIMTYYGFSSVLQRFVPVPVVPTAGALKGLDKMEVDAMMSPDWESTDVKDEKKSRDADENEDEKIARESKEIVISERLLGDQVEEVDDDREKNVTIAKLVTGDDETVQIADEPEALVADNTTFVSGALVADNITVVSGALVAENTTFVRSVENVTLVSGALVADNSSIIRSIENVTLVPARLVSDNSSIVHSVENVTVKSAAQVAENVTVVPVTDVTVTPVVKTSLRDALESVDKLTVKNEFKTIA